MKKKKQKHWILWFTLLFFVCFFSSFLLGRYPISPLELVKILLSKIFPISPTWEAQLETVLFQIRLPRVFMAVLIGGACPAPERYIRECFKILWYLPMCLGFLPEQALALL